MSNACRNGRRSGAARSVAGNQLRRFRPSRRRSSDCGMPSMNSSTMRAAARAGTRSPSRRRPTQLRSRTLPTSLPRSMSSSSECEENRRTTYGGLPGHHLDAAVDQASRDLLGPEHAPGKLGNRAITASSRDVSPTSATRRAARPGGGTRTRAARAPRRARARAAASSSTPTAISPWSRARLKPRQWCAPWLKARWWRAFSRRTSNRERVREHRRVAVRGEGRDADELAAAELDAAEGSRRARPALDEGHRRDQAQRLLDRVREQARIVAHGRELVRMLEQQQDRVHHHRLHRLDRAEQDHAQLRDDLVVGELDVRVVRDRGGDRPVGCARTRASSTVSSSSNSARARSARRCGSGSPS